MSEKDRDLEQLSRIREILFGEQISAIEQRLKELTQEYKKDINTLSQDLKVLIKEKETQYNELIKQHREELEKKLQQLGDDKVDKASLAQLFRNIASVLDGNNKA